MEKLIITAAITGSRITRVSRQKYLPPNWAPIPISLVRCSTRSSKSTSRKARPSGDPVNLSGRQIQNKQLPELIEKILQDTGCPAHCLELEITESEIMQNIHEAIRKIEQLRSFGVTFSIDDFGTGYSSLSYLQRLPVGILKIDRSFVKEEESHTAPLLRLAAAPTVDAQQSVIGPAVEPPLTATVARSRTLRSSSSSWRSTPTTLSPSFRREWARA